MGPYNFISHKGEENRGLSPRWNSMHTFLDRFFEICSTYIFEGLHFILRFNNLCRNYFCSSKFHIFSVLVRYFWKILFSGFMLEWFFGVFPKYFVLWKIEIVEIFNLYLKGFLQNHWFIFVKRKAVVIIVENLQPLLICQNISSSASDILLFPQSYLLCGILTNYFEGSQWKGGVKKKLYYTLTAIHPLNFCLKKMKGVIIEKWYPQKIFWSFVLRAAQCGCLKLNIFSLMLIKLTRKGCCRNRLK